MMLVGELILELQKYPANIEVTIYVGKCCDVQPIHRVHFQANECDGSPFVVLVDETIQVCISRSMQLLLGLNALPPRRPGTA